MKNQLEIVVLAGFDDRRNLTTTYRRGAADVSVTWTREVVGRIHGFLVLRSRPPVLYGMRLIYSNWMYPTIYVVNL